MRYSSRYRLVAKYHPPTSINFKKKGFDMKKYVVEIVEKVVYKVECSDISKEYAEKFARTMYDTGQLEGDRKSTRLNSSHRL